jgi:hypothetical protein
LFDGDTFGLQYLNSENQFTSVDERKMEQLPMAENINRADEKKRSEKTAKDGPACHLFSTATIDTGTTKSATIATVTRTRFILESTGHRPII